MRAVCRLVTAAADEPIVRSAVPTLQAPPVAGVHVPGVTGAPVRALFTFAIVALSAPKALSMLRIELTCALVRLAACATGARERIDAANASPVATAATFVIAFVVNVCITIVKNFREHVIIKW